MFWRHGRESWRHSNCVIRPDVIGERKRQVAANVCAKCAVSLCLVTGPIIDTVGPVIIRSLLLCSLRSHVSGWAEKLRQKYLVSDNEYLCLWKFPGLHGWCGRTCFGFFASLNAPSSGWLMWLGGRRCGVRGIGLLGPFRLWALISRIPLKHIPSAFSSYHISHHSPTPI
jgi:hypothetical protein